MQLWHFKPDTQREGTKVTIESNTSVAVTKFIFINFSWSQQPWRFIPMLIQN
jgi:hypothetical protein